MIAGLHPSTVEWLRQHALALRGALIGELQPGVVLAVAEDIERAIGGTTTPGLARAQRHQYPPPDPDRIEPNERREAIADLWEREREIDNERFRG